VVEMPEGVSVVEMTQKERRLGHKDVIELPDRP
jgi:hypothetical protein